MITGSFCVYRYTAICMYVINIKQERVVYILPTLNISRAFFLSLFFLTLAQRKHVFVASSLLSNCMRIRILSNVLNQIFLSSFLFKGSPNVNFQFLNFSISIFKFLFLWLDLMLIRHKLETNLALPSVPQSFWFLLLTSQVQGLSCRE